MYCIYLSTRIPRRTRVLLSFTTVPLDSLANAVLAPPKGSGYEPGYFAPGLGAWASRENRAYTPGKRRNLVDLCVRLPTRFRMHRGADLLSSGTSFTVMIIGAWRGVSRRGSVGRANEKSNRTALLSPSRPPQLPTSLCVAFTVVVVFGPLRYRTATAFPLLLPLALAVLPLLLVTSYLSNPFVASACFSLFHASPLKNARL